MENIKSKIIPEEWKKDIDELENYKVAEKDIIFLKEEVDKGFEINSNYDEKSIGSRRC